VKATVAISRSVIVQAIAIDKFAAIVVIEKLEGNNH
jgi:hypothetical protein